MVAAEAAPSSFATADICDTHPELLDGGDLRVLNQAFKSYGLRRAFCGPIVTLKLFEDNMMVLDVVMNKGDGRVLVIDGGGSMRRAMMGGLLCGMAQDNGWSGVLVNGCIRDVDEIDAYDIGVRALACISRRSDKLRVGEKSVPVHIGGTLIHEGEWLYADCDGVLISKTELPI